jgi:hypothetical protein
VAMVSNWLGYSWSMLENSDNKMWAMPFLKTKQLFRWGTFKRGCEAMDSIIFYLGFSAILVSLKRQLVFQCQKPK